MHIIKYLKKLDAIGITILLLHTVLMSILIYIEFFPSQPRTEWWNFFLPFLMDFPISIAFMEGSRIIADLMSSMFSSIDSYDLGLYIVAFFHIVFGALWWLGIYLVLKAIILKLAQKNA
jgi:hypothetical protein